MEKDQLPWRRMKHGQQYTLLLKDQEILIMQKEATLPWGAQGWHEKKGAEKGPRGEDNILHKLRIWSFYPLHKFR